MSQKQKSSQNGELKGVETGSRLATQSFNVENPSTLGTLGITLEVKNQQDSQLIPNFPENPNSNYVKMIMAFVSKLGKLVEVKKVTMRGGREGWVIFFPATNFEIDPVSKSLKPR